MALENAEGNTHQRVVGNPKWTTRIEVVSANDVSLGSGEGRIPPQREDPALLTRDAPVQNVFETTPFQELSSPIFSRIVHYHRRK